MAVYDTRYLRPYRGGDDLPPILRFVGECNALSDFCGYLHPGDVCHFLSNTLRGRDSEDHLYVYETPERGILGLVLLYPIRFGGYDLLIHPDARGSVLETALIEWSEARLWGMIQAGGGSKTSVGSDVMTCDVIRRDLLVSRGYSLTAPGYLRYTIRLLSDVLPVATLPEGYTIRCAEGEHEAGELGEAHSGAFGSNWTADEYRRVMRTPGFQIDHELVVVAPDGRFAAFLVYWIDPVSNSGLFEPVGCHKDFQRRGLTKALMVEGLWRMIDRGMRFAIVIHDAPDENPASAALYRSVGFTEKYALDDYRKTMT